MTDDKLVIQWSNFRNKLEHFHFDTFIAMGKGLGNEQAVFTLGADGEVSGMNLLGVNFKKQRARE